MWQSAFSGAQKATFREADFTGVDWPNGKFRCLIPYGQVKSVVCDNFAISTFVFSCRYPHARAGSGDARYNM